MSGFIAFAGGLLIGLLCSGFFIAGFKVRADIEAGNVVFGKPKKMEPYLNTSREALIEQRRAEALDGFDLKPYETE